MARAHSGSFVPKNPQKYVAANIHNITYRSSWEQSMMMVLDNHPNVVGWASEAVRIPYQKPVMEGGHMIMKATFYVPDFFVVYEDRDGKRHTELIEIKPSDEHPSYGKKTSRLKEARQALNALKWQAALKFCQARGWTFRVATDRDLFGMAKKSGS
jgi:hypothetical protein